MALTVLFCFVFDIFKDIFENQRHASFLGNCDNVLHRLKTDVVHIEIQLFLYPKLNSRHVRNKLISVLG